MQGLSPGILHNDMDVVMGLICVVNLDNMFMVHSFKQLDFTLDTLEPLWFGNSALFICLNCNFFIGGNMETKSHCCVCTLSDLRSNEVLGSKFWIIGFLDGMVCEQLIVIFPISLFLLDHCLLDHLGLFFGIGGGDPV